MKKRRMQLDREVLTIDTVDLGVDAGNYVFGLTLDQPGGPVPGGYDIHAGNSRPLCQSWQSCNAPGTCGTCGSCPTEFECTYDCWTHTRDF